MKAARDALGTLAERRHAARHRAFRAMDGIDVTARDALREACCSKRWARMVVLRG